MKRILSLILTISMLFSFTAFAADTASEDSVVQTVKALGIMRGDQNGNMDLGRDIARAEFVKMMVSASSHKDSISAEGAGYSLFSDVKSSHWASEYIRIAVNEKWVVGYTDGSFRPGKTITLEEACTALLRLLGYNSENLAGSFPAAQLNKAEALGLRNGIVAKRGEELTRRDCMYLFYNLLTAKTSNGQVYANTLGYSVSNNKVDYMSVITEGIKGPYLAEGTPSLPFDTTYATVYRDGKASSISSIAPYDIYYYNADMNTVWVYTDKVSGTISALSPNATNPTSISIGGKDYKIETPDAQYKLSALSGVKVGDVVTVLLGMNGTVVSVMSGDRASTVYYGVVRACTRELNDQNSASVQTKVTVGCTDGSVQTFTLSRDVELATGKVVSVTVSSGGVKISALSDKTISGTVNKNGTKIGSYTFAEDINIIDAAKSGNFVSITPERLAGCTISSSGVRFYSLNAKGEISHLILNDITGDTWTYGYVTNVTKGDNSTPSYTVMIKGNTTNIRGSEIKFAVSEGGVAIRYGADGSVSDMMNLSFAQIGTLSANIAVAGNKTYTVSDDVQVYLREDGKYYLTDLSAVNSEDYTLSGIYDGFATSAGGRIRVIIAIAK